MGDWRQEGYADAFPQATLLGLFLAADFRRCSSQMDSSATFGATLACSGSGGIAHHLGSLSHSQMAKTVVGSDRDSSGRDARIMLCPVGCGRESMVCCALWIAFLPAPVSSCIRDGREP